MDWTDAEQTVMVDCVAAQVAKMLARHQVAAGAAPPQLGKVSWAAAYQHPLLSNASRQQVSSKFRRMRELVAAGGEGVCPELCQRIAAMETHLRPLGKS